MARPGPGHCQLCPASRRMGWSIYISTFLTYKYKILHGRNVADTGHASNLPRFFGEGPETARNTSFRGILCRSSCSRSCP